MATIENLLHEYVVEGPYVLPSGITTPRHFDQGYLFHPQHKLEVAVALSERIDVVVERIAGIELGGALLAAAVSDVTLIPFVAIRKEERRRTSPKMIEGQYNRNDRVLLVEDTVTTGATLQSGIRVLEDHGLVVAQVLVVCDRSADGSYNSLIDLPV